MIHQGDLTITSANAKTFSGLTSITGSLYTGAEANLPLLESVGGSLDIRANANLPLLRRAHGRAGRLIAASEYGLWWTGEVFYAGCRGPFTKAEALAHWDRDDERALVFTLAINFCT